MLLVQIWCNSPRCTFEHTPTESLSGGTLMNISELKSIFIKIITPNKPSSIMGTIYKHPSMKPYKLKNKFLKLNHKFLEPLQSKNQL